MSTNLQVAMRKYQRAADVRFHRRTILETLLTPILKDIFHLRIDTSNDYVNDFSVGDSGITVYYTSHACGQSSSEDLFIPNRILFAEDPRAERNKMIDEEKQMREMEDAERRRELRHREQEAFWNRIAGNKKEA